MSLVSHEPLVIQRERARREQLERMREDVKEKLESTYSETISYIENIENINSLRGLIKRLESLTEPRPSAAKRARKTLREEKENS